MWARLTCLLVIQQDNSPVRVDSTATGSHTFLLAYDRRRQQHLSISILKVVEVGVGVTSVTLSEYLTKMAGST